MRRRRKGIMQYIEYLVYYCRLSVQSSELGPSTPSPPHLGRGGHTHLRGRGRGDPIQTTGQNPILVAVVLFGSLPPFSRQFAYVHATQKEERPGGKRKVM
jgi:hypothetical protein